MDGCVCPSKYVQVRLIMSCIVGCLSGMHFRSNESLAEREGFDCRRPPQVTVKTTRSDKSPVFMWVSSVFASSGAVPIVFLMRRVSTKNGISGISGITEKSVIPRPQPG
jgi:hypothetical protein